MRKSALYITLIGMMLLPSCTSLPTQGRDDGKDAMRQYQSRNDGLPDGYSMLDLGWALSAGKVYLYDPWLPMLTFPNPPIAEFDTWETSVFPPHVSMVVKDEDVHVYTLSSHINPDMPVLFNLRDDDAITVEDISEIPMPVPLISEEMLAP
jgi:hypothetical protein